jgi:Raf kinase inhibitor-like YbhB/YbcL family protein
MNFLTLLVMMSINHPAMTIKSPSFAANSYIPTKFTCDGANVSPDLMISDIPKECKSLALIMDDPDAPNGTFVHWVMWNIPPNQKIGESMAPGIQGLNGKKENKYTGPCPPSGTHHYHFKIYALDSKLELGSTTDKQALETAMKGHILAAGELVALYKR